MLKRLRLHLTGLYLLAALGLTVLVGAGAYTLLSFYFQNETDLALSSKMALAFRQLNLSPPKEVLLDEQEWRSGGLAEKSLLPPAASTGRDQDSDPDEHGEDGEDQESSAEKDHDEDNQEERYDARLASIFVHVLNPAGRELIVLGDPAAPYPLEQASIDAAAGQGYDRRTVKLASGERLRLLTYRVDSSTGPFYLQTGRSLADQDRVLGRFLAGLIGLGIVAGAVVGAGSWWLSGQSLLPAQRSWDQQQTFIANASHELRTPLTLIKASTEVLKRSPDDPVEQAVLVDDILSECAYMNRLIDDLLLLSRLDARRLQLSRQPVALNSLIEDVARQGRRLAGEQGVQIEVGNTDGTVLADPERLRQVLLILQDNAIRHTPPGGRIRLGTEGRRQIWRISVADTGEGIPPEHLPHVFERFYQANPTGEGTARTNGLGLAIAKAIIAALDGKLTLTSEVGKGTRAVIELATAYPAAAPGPEDAKAS